MISKLTLSVFLITLSLFTFSQDFYRVGAEENVTTEPSFGILLAGGASDNDDGMEWLTEHANGGDVVVLRASGSDGYNNYIYSQLGVEVNSVTSIVIQSPQEADNPDVCQAVEDSELVFLAGGNQWNYYHDWSGTCLQEALNHHVNQKSAPIGGTSAGLAVLGEVVYTAENGTVWSEEALNNPYHFRVKLEKDFLDVPFLENLVTDSHYDAIYGDNNNRHGRHMAFMARMMADWEMAARGIGVDEYTAVGVDENGLARVFGHPDHDDYAYFVRANEAPEVCETQEPLHWYHDKKAVSVYKAKGDFSGSSTFDLTNMEEGTGGEWFYWYAENGQLTYGAEVSFEVTGDNGVIEATVEQQPINPGDAVTLGNDVVFIALPDEGYRVKEWMLNGELQPEISTRFSYNELEKKIFVQLEFEEAPDGTYTVNYYTGQGEGEISATSNNSPVINGESIEEGVDIVFSAEPAHGYEFSHWTVNGDTLLDNNHEPVTEATFTHESLDTNIVVAGAFKETPEDDKGVLLRWDVASTANTPQYREEYYSVWISIDGTDPQNFVKIFDETLDPSVENWEYQPRSISISEYEDQEVHIAYRHHESTNNDRIMINNVKVEFTPEEENKERVVIFEEDFQGGLNWEEVDSDWLPENWQVVDHNGDGYSWYYDAYEGDGYMLSASFFDGSALHPDNWLITPGITLSTDLPSYIATESGKPDISIYPNPARQVLNINNNHAAPIINLSILAPDGRLIKENQTSFHKHKQLNISSLAPGFYLLSAVDERGNTYTLKFVKQL